MSKEIKNLSQLEAIKKAYIEKNKDYKYQIMVCGGAGCISSNCGEIQTALEDEIAERGLTKDVSVLQTGCMGTCAVGPVMLVMPDEVYYTNLTVEKVKDIVEKHLIGGDYIEEYTFYDSALEKFVPKLSDINFFKDQVKIVLRNCGSIDYSSIDAYIAKDGYFAIHKALQKMSRTDVIDTVKASGLRGRGGGGFPTGLKWEAGYKADSQQKYIICNADEGDPGAFMDRSLLEGDPHGIIEAMMIGGYAIGANHGFVYVRAEYPVAVERLGIAIEQAREYGLLGKKLFETDFEFDLEIRIGAGAFVCGEETSLMASTEGQRGEPKQKPPFPFEKGLFDKPTIINNVETLANIPPIVLKGSEWFTQFGNDDSKGTKVFALAGNITNTGIVEVPMGTILGDVIYKIGGGIPNGKAFKAAQLGGPSGGCITGQNLGTPLDYSSISNLGAMMGSGGLIVMNEDTCMVDTARFFLDFIQDESCGKCTPCRLGTKRMLETLERITLGQGKPEDLDVLVELGEVIKDTAMCGLGQTASNPILSTLNNFKIEYEEHIENQYCRAGVCSTLFISPCQNSCPAGINIPGYMALTAQGRFVEAYNLIMQENPFPAVCGRICNHPCEPRCRRTQIDEALAIRDIKRFVADYAFAQNKAHAPANVKKNGQSVGIIGAGPSGLTCAYYLARLGYDVDVYEANSVAGGMLAVGIPEYRLPEDVLQREIDVIKSEGVNIHLDSEVGKNIKLEALRDMHDAIYLANGTIISKKIGIMGEDLPGVIHGVDFLRLVNLDDEIKIGKKVVVIGGGNTAIDAARTALRLGAEDVCMLYRRTIKEMPADPREVEEAIEEGIRIIELAAPVKITGKDIANGIECQQMKLSGFDHAGRPAPRPVEGSNYVVDADMIIPAISQIADLEFVDDDLRLTSWGCIAAHRNTTQTNLEGVFSGGDVARGADVAITAIADGKKAATNIDLYLGGKGILNKGEEIEIPVVENQGDLAEHKRFDIGVLDPKTRKGNFQEVVTGYQKINAMAEAMRCLRCDRR